MGFLSLVFLFSCGAEEAPPVPATFAEVYDDILALSCGFSTCHGGGAGGFYLGELSEAYGALVNVESAEAAGETLVIPGDADNSYLIHKLEGAAGIVGGLMPPSSPISNEAMDRVRSWINAGALASSSASNASFRP